MLGPSLHSLLLFVVLICASQAQYHHFRPPSFQDSSEEDFRRRPPPHGHFGGPHHGWRGNEVDFEGPPNHRGQHANSYGWGFEQQDQLGSAERRLQRDGHRQRICEKKYAEYISRIFPGEEDTVQDASDSDFDGRVLARPGEYPHMAALGYKEEQSEEVDYKCGGSLISERFVITAAHCANFTGQSPTTVRIGDLNLKVEEGFLDPQMRRVKRVHTHPEYKTTSNYNDIALLELDRDVRFTEFVRPIRLWVRTVIPYALAYAMGYGSTAFGKARTDRLTDLNMTIVSNEDCNKTMPVMEEAAQGIIASQICALDYKMNRDTCQGDSGGPLQLNLHGRRRHNRQHYHLIGITSYGLYCRSGYPSVYTRVSSFLDWIEQIAWRSDT